MLIALLWITSLAVMLLLLGLMVWQTFRFGSLYRLQMRTEEQTRSNEDLVRQLLQNLTEKMGEHFTQQLLHSQRSFHEHRTQVDEHQLHGLKLLQDTLLQGFQQVRQEVTTSLQNSSQDLGLRVNQLTTVTHERLKEISLHVDQRLSEGFEKSTATFIDIIKRLALIDEAQKKIAELSHHVVSLQEVLVDKRARGAFGEVQLSVLIHNMLPENGFAFQYSLRNGKRADCILFLPPPTGNIIIDAKFPLESFRRMTDISLPQNERTEANQQFRLDIRKHIQDIASKYIIPEETAEGAMMFIPAEAIFAEIHAHFPELVELSQKMRVWMASPTTMMAILTTARAVLKDEATKQQVHQIQEHLQYLAKDFERFQDRMDNLAKHIDQAHEDVTQVHVSAKKITERFNKIERVELPEHHPTLENHSD